jgi:hypothetical protein
MFVMFVIEGRIGGELVFTRTTPALQGIDALINEGLSALQAADADDNDYIEVLRYYPEDPSDNEPEVVGIVFIRDGYITDYTDELDLGIDTPAEIMERSEIPSSKSEESESYWDQATEELL